jgi:hypothetical protein
MCSPSAPWWCGLHTDATWLSGLQRITTRNRSSSWTLRHSNLHHTHSRWNKANKDDGKTRGWRRRQRMCSRSSLQDAKLIDYWTTRQLRVFVPFFKRSCELFVLDLANDQSLFDFFSLLAMKVQMLGRWYGIITIITVARHNFISYPKIYAMWLSYKIQVIIWLGWKKLGA